MLQHISVAAGQYLAQMQHEIRFPLVRVEDRQIVIYDRLADGREHDRYFVPIDQLQTAQGVAFWFRQLAGKSWVTTRHLLLLASRIHDLPSDG